jgi:hypothetical protein
VPRDQSIDGTDNSWNAQNMGFLSRCDWYLKRQGKRQFRAYHDRSLKASGDASLTLKTLRQLLPYYLKSMPTGQVSAAI